MYKVENKIAKEECTSIIFKCVFNEEIFQTDIVLFILV